jgi:hypothetical protein
MSKLVTVFEFQSNKSLISVRAPDGDDGSLRGQIRDLGDRAPLKIQDPRIIVDVFLQLFLIPPNQNNLTTYSTSR